MSVYLMDSFHILSSLDDSLHPRSRANSYNSQVSVGESGFQALNLSDNLGSHLTVPGDIATSESRQDPSTSANAEPHNSPSFLDSPPSHLLFPLTDQSVLLQNWPNLESTIPAALPITDAPSSETPLLLLQQPQDQVESDIFASRLESIPSSFDQATMSTLGVQFDARFDAGTRSSYTWPVFDVNEPFVNSDLLPMDSFNDSNFMPVYARSLSSSPLQPPFASEQQEIKPTFMPVYARSLSSSPPQAPFTSEQREIKRQRDQARRDSKTRMRRDRSASNSYNTSQAPTPDLIPRSSASYSSSMAPTPILTETTIPTSMPLSMGQGYLTSTPLSSSASPELYGTAFPLGSNGFPSGFLMPYSPAPELRLPTYRPRPHSMSSASDLPFLYQNTIASVPQEAPETVRVVHSRPKPQCWDHGCNGRQFSTFSNLLRHQREKSGAASKPTCPKCGAEFTRTTARNGHMAHEKCKQRRNS